MLLINIFVLSLLFWRLYTFLACSSSDVSGEPTSEDSGSLQDSLPQISAVAAYSKGFACSSSPGVVLLFEKTNKEVYKESQEIWVGEKKLLQAITKQMPIFVGRRAASDLIINNHS